MWKHLWFQNHPEKWNCGRQQDFGGGQSWLHAGDASVCAKQPYPFPETARTVTTANSLGIRYAAMHWEISYLQYQNCLQCWLEILMIFLIFSFQARFFEKLVWIWVHVASLRVVVKSPTHRSCWTGSRNPSMQASSFKHFRRQAQVQASAHRSLRHTPDHPDSRHPSPSKRCYRTFAHSFC